MSCHQGQGRQKMAMDKRHRRVLQQNTTRLADDLDPLSILGYLYQEKALVEADMERIRGEKIRRDQVMKLLSILPRRGARAFDTFCEVLYKIEGQRHLAKMLKEDIENSRGNPSQTTMDSPPSLQQRLTPDQIVILPTDHRYLPKTLTADDNVYKMQSNPRGLCLIINNTTFAAYADLKQRDGSDADALNLQKLFLCLRYTVTVLRNATAQMLRAHVRAFASRPEHRSFDSVVVCILSHGITGKVYGIDGELVSIAEITSEFNGQNAKDLIGKPKLFFIQACRGGGIDHGASTDQVDSGEVTVKSTSDILRDLYEGQDETDFNYNYSTGVVAAEADFLLAYSTVPGFVSWRNSEKGSWFVQALCEVIMTYAGQEDLVSMLVRVNGKVALEFASYDQKKQIPSPVVRLTKKVYFFPGY